MSKVQSHDAPWHGIAHCNLEWHVINFTEGLFRDMDMDSPTLPFCFIRCKMLDCGADTSRLEAIDISGGDVSAQDRIFRITLEMSTA
jgi:endogenous inhibitor of DNA gyrase (YacG/DUF329 family)